MVSTLRQFLAPPVFTGDDEKTRLAALLNSILLITLGVNLALNPALILVLENPVPSLMVDGGLVVLQIGVWFLMRRGQVRLASLLFCLTLWVYVSFVSLTFGGFDSLLPVGYIVLIFVAGILLRRSEIYGFWVLSLVGIAALIYIELNHQLPPPLVPITPMYKGLVIGSILLATAALLGLALGSITEALARARREIAERQRVEQELRVSSAHLRRLTDNMVDMITEIDANVTTRYISPSVERRLGYRPVDMLGRNALELIHPDDLPQVMAALQAANTARVPVQLAYRYRHADGHYLWLESIGTPLLDEAGGLVGAVLGTRDITERWEIEQALQVSEERLRQAVRAANIGIFDHDHLTDAIYWSPEQRNNYGWGADETVTLAAFLAQVYAEDRARIGAAVQRAHNPAGDGLFDVEHRIRHRDGSLRWLSTRSQTFFEGDDNARHPVRTIGAVLDITERKQAEDVIRNLNAELEQRVQERTAQLEAANQELESFSYSVSHDLRAPLRTIDGFSRILLDEHAPQLPAEAQHYLQRIRYGASHMGALIDDLLEFSRLGWQALNLQPVNTASLVRAILNDLRPEQAQRQLELVMGALPDCQADSALFKQVWVNLLSNAFKYTRQRAAARVEIGALTPGDEVVYFVRDNGVGFDMRYADKLFGVFQRLHRMDEFEGTGVGLATVKRIVERHGGRIWAEAEPDRGATFYVALPAR